MPQAKMTVTPGMTFNYLTVESTGERSKAGHPRWNCKCVCGRVKVIRQSHLVALTVTSCGCKTERLVKHGMYGTPTYRSWNAMKARGLNPDNKQFPNYGGAGRTVCERWYEFENFLADMGERPQGTTLDRIDNDKGYFPDNCRWATAKEQSNNRGNNRRIKFEGLDLTLAEWCRLLGVNYERAITRMLAGHSFVDAVTLPLNYIGSVKYRKICKRCSEPFERGHSARVCEKCANIRAAEAKRQWKAKQVIEARQI